MLSREQILAADDLPREKVSVPEWGGDVFVRTITAAQRETWEKLCADGTTIKINNRIRASILTLTVCDEAGNLLFTPDDAPALAEKAAPVVVRLFDAAQKLNQVSKEDIDELEKN